jgi:hypothetical protein
MASTCASFGHVGLHRERGATAGVDLLHHSLCRVSVGCIVDGDGIALARGQQRRGGAYAPAGAGDQNGLFVGLGQNLSPAGLVWVSYNPHYSTPHAGCHPHN